MSKKPELFTNVTISTSPSILTVALKGIDTTAMFTTPWQRNTSVTVGAFPEIF
jgi:hypothetical protein